MGDKVAFVVGEVVPVSGVGLEVNLLGSPKRGFGFLVHAPDVVVLEGKENKTVWIFLDERFWCKESLVFSVLVYQRLGGK